MKTRTQSAQTNVNKNIKQALAITLSLSSLTAFGGPEGGGVRGGGFVVYRNGTPRTLDLVTQAVCNTVTGAELLQRLPTARDTIEKLIRLDWYLGRDFKRNIENLEICLTGPLYRLDPTDRDSVVVQNHDGALQGGIRIIGTNRVFLDNALFNTLSELDQSNLLIHEAGHAYLDPNSPQRMMRHNTLVVTFHRVQIGQITTRAQLYTQLRGLDLNFPLSANYLDTVRPQVDFLLSSHEDRSQLILNSRTPEALIATPVETILAHLSAQDASHVMADRFYNLRDLNRPEHPFIRALQGAMIAATPAQFVDLLTVKPWLHVNPVQIGIAIFDQLSSQNQETLTRQSEFLVVAVRGFEEIIQAQLTYSEYRIMAPRLIHYLALGEQMDEDVRVLRPLTELQPQTSGGRILPLTLTVALQSSIQVIVSLAKNQQWQALESIFTENSVFYEALSLSHQHAAIRTMNPYVSREKQLATAILTRISGALRTQFLSTVNQRLMAQDPSGNLAQEFARRIHSDRFTNSSSIPLN